MPFARYKEPALSFFLWIVLIFNPQLQQIIANLLFGSLPRVTYQIGSDHIQMNEEIIKLQGTEESV